MNNELLWMAVAGLALACVALAGVLVRTLVGIRRLRRGAHRFAHGDLSQPIPQRGPGRVVGLAVMLNRMAEQLQERLSAVSRQRNELEAVLGGMAEGVVAVDLERRLMNLNRAAAAMLETEAGKALGRQIQEVVRNAALQDFVAAAVGGEESIQAEVVLHGAGGGAGEEERFIQAQAASLRDAAGVRIGVLIVLHDVTRLQRLERVRRDFVANVSHELKTPITAIKGAVETLLDPAGCDEQTHRQFLGMIQRQSDRLAAIIDDLLSLARIEQGSEAGQLAMGNRRLVEVVAGARETCQLQARGKGIRLEFTGGDEVAAKVNGPLLEQAVVNLLHNAIKFSNAGTVVRVSVVREGAEAMIAVADEGMGIEPEHLPRIFERFYRPDKARSRQLGGTGLGLAIVKHIAQAHSGRISVDSVVGRGSTFRIHLPIR